MHVFFYCCTSLQTCATYLAFGEFGVAYRSKRGGFVSCLEGYLLCGAPNVGNLSHVWRVICCVALQMWGICLMFGGFASTQCRTIINRHGCFVLTRLCVFVCAELRRNRLNVNPGSTGARRSIFPVPEKVLQSVPQHTTRKAHFLCQKKIIK